MEVGESWAAWLRTEMERRGMIAADLSRAGGRKTNGRPVIDPSTITQWLRGRRASYDLAGAVADVLGISRDEARRAAGYDVQGQSAVDDARARVQWPQPNTRMVRDKLETARIAIDQAMAALDRLGENDG